MEEKKPDILFKQTQQAIIDFKVDRILVNQAKTKIELEKSRLESLKPPLPS